MHLSSNFAEFSVLEFPVIEFPVFRVSSFRVSGFRVSGFGVSGFRVSGFRVFSFSVFGLKVSSFRVSGFRVCIFPRPASTPPCRHEDHNLSCHAMQAMKIELATQSPLKVPKQRLGRGHTQTFKSRF